MTVGIICHSVVAPFSAPDHDPYDRYELKLHQPKRGTGARDMLSEWADVIGFANRSVAVKQQKVQGPYKKTVNKARQQSGCNKLHLNGCTAFTAGNRYGLPAEIDLNWGHFQHFMNMRKQSPEVDFSADENNDDEQEQIHDPAD